MSTANQFVLDTPVAFSTALAAAAYPAAAAVTIGSTATDGAIGTGTVLYLRQTGVCALKLRFVGFTLTTSITGGTAAVLSVVARPTIGSNTNARVIGTLTIPATAVIGDVCYGSFSDDDTNLNPGEELMIYLSTKATTAGAGFLAVGYTTSLVGPTSGGTATVPVTRTKPFGTGVGSIKLMSSGTTGN